ncbi:hypothetical protein F5Y13DRAFT_185275 [Hypoxylon sp. FL1857]|nr:hypothetical protein F5Y13DRAFT_185275 [Hypoxylon sp. FL1857]
MSGPPTPEDVAHMLSRPNDNMAPNVIVCCSIALVIATISIGLRLWSRKVLNGKLHLDLSDWLAILAWVMYLPYTATMILTTRYGLGRHIVFVTDLRLFSIYTMVNVHLYVVTLALLKFSVLCLYRKIFSSSPRFYRWTWVIAALVAEWMLQVILATDLQCIPISATWDPTIRDRSTCINHGIEAVAAYVINITTELAILSMPIPLIIKLNVSKSEKRRLIIVFAVGGSACVASLVQLKYIAQPRDNSDPSWDSVPSGMLGDIEIMICFLATSIATYRPLYHLIFKESTAVNSENSHSAGKKTPHHENIFEVTQYSANVRGGVMSTLDRSLKYPQGGITVTNDIEMTRQDNVRGSWVRVYDDPEPFHGRLVVSTLL